MPHRGHTTIEMSPNRGRAERHEGHENPRVHETPIIIPPRHSRSPSPSDNRRHRDAHHTNHDNNHLTVGNTHHPIIGSSNGHSSTAHHDKPTAGHSNSQPHRSSHERLPTNNDHHAPEDSTPLLFRTRREAIEPSDPEHGNTETTVNITPDLARPKPDLRINIDVANDKSQGLREPGITSPKPPIAGPEMDDLEGDDDIPNTAEAHPGVDDGFFSPGDRDKPDDGRETDDEGHPQYHPEDPLFTPWERKNGHDDDDKNTHPTSDEGDGLMPGDPRLTPRFGSETPFPYAPEFAPGAVPPTITPDVNVYQQKKNLAQGMMDLALLSANANQLRYVLEAGDYHPYYYASLIFISFSLILQIAVGVGLIANGTYDIKNEEDMHKANNLNNYTIIGVFLITVINIILSAFVIAVGVGLIINSTYNIKDRYDICKADKINNFTVIGIFLITVVNVFVASFGVSQLPQPNSTGPNN